MPRTTFLDQFAVADQDLEGVNGWTTGGGGVLVADNVAVGESSGLNGAAVQNDVVASAERTLVRAGIICFSQDAEAKIIVGGYYDGSTDFLTVDNAYAILVDFSGYVAPNPTVMASVIYAPTANLFSAPVVAGPVDVTSSLLVDPEDQSATPALGVVQEVSLLLTMERAGARLRAYFNNEDRDKPTLEAIHSVENRSGRKWFFAIGGHATAGEVGVAYFSGEDVERTSVQTLRFADAPTVREIIDAAESRYSGNTGFADDRKINYVRWAIDDILNDLGSKAFWMRPTENVSFDLSGGYARAPEYIEEIYSLKVRPNSSTRREPNWHVVGTDTEGRLLVRIDPPWEFQGDSGPLTYEVRYRLRHEAPSSLTDVVPIPRRLDELVVLGVLRRMAMDSPKTTGLQVWVAEYERLLAKTKLYCARFTNQEHSRLHVRRLRRRSRYYLDGNVRGY